ncbi:uncharacterized protein LOC133533094 [Cydia pomonella]|uniref:uncharacterized protein LOC133533094 n=1 Tax=Cydia pomonella TaxID=82600 RepID=UPI002ADD6F7C|nr:uncharacterized protein LOC133533094 [Cydia pomonella]
MNITGAVSMLVALVLVLVARAGAAGAHSDHDNTRSGSGAAGPEAAGRAGARPCTEDQRPKITTSAFIKLPQGVYKTSYGEDINIYCYSSKNFSNLEITQNGTSLQILPVNATTVRFCANKPNIGVYTYRCVNMESDSGCESFHSVAVVVHPTMSVMSRSVMTYFSEVIHTQIYYVPFGEEYEVVCSSHDTTSLHIIDFNNKRMPRHSVNNTSITYKTRAADQEVLRWKCSYEGISVTEIVVVVIDYYPKSDYFHCLIRDWRILDCIWSYPTRDGFTYSLFYIGHGNDTKGATMLHYKMPGAKINTFNEDITLRGHKSFTFNQTFSLLVMTCFKELCVNETFNYNINSLIELKWHWAPGVIRTSPHNVVLNLYSPRYPSAYHIFCDTCIYKVEMRINSSVTDGWRQADTSSVRCNYNLLPFHCRFTLPLPYPDSEYEVRVSARHRDSVDDRLWLDPRSIYVRTKPRAACACNAGNAVLQTPAGPTVPSEACKACTHTEQIVNESFALKNRINSLREKLHTINVLSEIQKLKDKIKKSG